MPRDECSTAFDLLQGKHIYLGLILPGHGLRRIITIAICDVLSSADSFEEMVTWEGSREF